MTRANRRCPRCGGVGMLSPDARNTPSRKDGTTRVCNACRAAEGLLYLLGEDTWATYPHPIEPKDDPS